MNEALTYRYQSELFTVLPVSGKQPEIRAATPKPFVKWVGGKSQLLHELTSCLPSDFEKSITTYIEPFTGGGAFLFWILSHYTHLQRVIINDANEALINTYKVIRDNPDNLIDILLTFKIQYQSLKDEEERKIYYYGKREAFNSGNATPAEQAAYLIFLNRTCFNGLYRVNAKGKFNVPHGSYKNPLICDPDTIQADSKALANVEICHGDFAAVLKEADEHSFVYFDPPYRPLSKTSSFCSYCEGGFDDNEQRRLARCCHKLDHLGVRWLLSNSDPKGLCPEDNFFEELYCGFNIKSVQASRMLNANPEKRGKLSELLICNYDS